MSRRFLSSASLSATIALLGACGGSDSSTRGAPATGGQPGAISASDGTASNGPQSSAGGAGALATTSGGTGGIATAIGFAGAVPAMTGGAVSTPVGGAPSTPAGGAVSTPVGGAPSTPTGGTPSTSSGGDTSSPAGGTTSSPTGGAPGATGGTATDPIACDRAGLYAAADSYISALVAGDPSRMSLSAAVEYSVNDSVVALAAGEGLFQWATEPDLYRHFADTEACRTFTEIICASWSHQYVLGVALTITGGEISNIYVVETDDGDWAFGADNYLSRTQSEIARGDWDWVPDAQRLSREELDSGARAYFAYWGDESVNVPWGDPCGRLEGGSFGAFDTALADSYTEDGQWGSCSVGIPHDGFSPQPRESIVDPDYGMVVLLLNLGGADSHLFRFNRDPSLVERTGFDYGMNSVHTLTVQQ